MLSIVYRVENTEGYGPYSYIPRRELKDLIGRKHGSIFTSITRPLPENDGIDMGQDTELVCGFSSMSQLKKWFTPKDIEKLLSVGFFIKKYHSNTILKGGKQVMFKKENTTEGH